MFSNLLFGLLIIRSIISNIWIKSYTLRSMSYSSQDTQLIAEKRLYFILKVFNEQECIGRTIDYLWRITKDKRNVHIIIVGNNRERTENGINPTLEIASKKIIEYPEKFIIFECPLEEAHQAEQVNFACQKILDTKPENVWVWLIDIDSRCGINGLNEMITYINQGCKVLLQHAHFLDNFNSLSPFQKGQALYQSRWTICEEMKRIAFNRLTGFGYYHVVGHGLCINLERFKRYNLFPEKTPIEDMAFGFLLSCNSEKIISLVSLEAADTPVSALAGYRQQQTWALGPLMMLGYYRIYIKSCMMEPRSTPRAIVALITGLSSFIAWICITPLIAWTIYMTYHHNPFALFYLSLYTAEFFQCSLFFFRKGLLTSQQIILSPLYIILDLLRRSIPALHALMNAVFFDRYLKFKTEHK